MKYQVDFGTKRNTKVQGKPNEDFALTDSENGIYIIVDGVSRDKINGVYPNPSPSEQVSKAFAECAYHYLCQRPLDTEELLPVITEAFREGNEKVHECNKEYEGGFLPGTVGIIAVIREEKLFYGYIGDCVGLLIAKNEKKQFTTCQTKQVHDHIKEFTASQVRGEICNNKNHPYAYGVLDGREGAMDFVLTGCLDLTRCDGIVLATDGAEEIVGNLKCEELLSRSAADMLSDKSLTDNEDDKTIVLVKCSA